MPDVTEDINALVDKVFLLPPQTKKDLKEVFPQMPEGEKQEFLAYINSILTKQDEIITYLVKNNPDFLSELKAFNASNEKKMIANLEKEFAVKEELDMKALEEALKKL